MPMEENRTSHSRHEHACARACVGGTCHGSPKSPHTPVHLQLPNRDAHTRHTTLRPAQARKRPWSVGQAIPLAAKTLHRAAVRYVASPRFLGILRPSPSHVCGCCNIANGHRTASLGIASLDAAGRHAGGFSMGPGHVWHAAEVRIGACVQGRAGQGRIV